MSALVWYPRGLSSPGARTQTELCGIHVLMSKFASECLTTAILKLRLRATLEFYTFQTRLRAPASASKNETPVKYAAVHVVTCPCYAAVTPMGSSIPHMHLLNRRSSWDENERCKEQPTGPSQYEAQLATANTSLSNLTARLLTQRATSQFLQVLRSERGGMRDGWARWAP